MAKKTNSALFSSLLYIIIGVILIIFRAQALEWVMTAIGVIFIVSGVLDILKKNITGGAVSLVIGLLVLILGWTATKIVLLVLGILIALKGIVALLEILKNSRKNIIDLIFPILTIVVGIMLAFGNMLDILIIVAGVLLAVNGVVGLLGSAKK